MRRKSHRTKLLTLEGVQVPDGDGTLVADVILEADLYALARSVARKAILSKTGKVRIRGGLIVVSAPHVKKV